MMKIVLMYLPVHRVDQTLNIQMNPSRRDIFQMIVPVTEMYHKVSIRDYLTNQTVKSTAVQNVSLFVQNRFVQSNMRIQYTEQNHPTNVQTVYIRLLNLLASTIIFHLVTKINHTSVYIVLFVALILIVQSDISLLNILKLSSSVTSVIFQPTYNLRWINTMKNIIQIWRSVAY